MDFVGLFTHLTAIYVASKALGELLEPGRKIDPRLPDLAGLPANLSARSRNGARAPLMALVPPLDFRD